MHFLLFFSICFFWHTFFFAQHQDDWLILTHKRKNNWCKSKKRSYRSSQGALVSKHSAKEIKSRIECAYLIYLAIDTMQKLLPNGYFLKFVLSLISSRWCGDFLRSSNVPSENANAWIVFHLNWFFVGLNLKQMVVARGKCRSDINIATANAWSRRLRCVYVFWINIRVFVGWNDLVLMSIW